MSDLKIEKMMIIEKARKLFGEGARIGFLKDEGHGDYCLKDISRPMEEAFEKYLENENYQLVTLERCADDECGFEEITP